MSDRDCMCLLAPLLSFWGILFMTLPAISEKSLPLPLTHSRANVTKVNWFCFYSTLKLNKSLNAVLSAISNKIVSWHMQAIICFVYGLDLERFIVLNNSDNFYQTNILLTDFQYSMYTDCFLLFQEIIP